MHNIIFIFSGSRVYFEVFGGKIKKNSSVEPHNYRQVGLFRRYTLSTSSAGIRATHPRPPRAINKQILMYVGISLSRRLYYDIMLNHQVFRLQYLLYLRSSITMEIIRQRNQFSPYKD